MAIQIVKIEDLDVSKISFSYKESKDKKTIEYFWMNYNGAPVYIQFPKSRPLFKGASDYNDMKKFSVNIDLTHTPEILEKTKKIDEMCQEFAKVTLKKLTGFKKGYNELVKYRKINDEPIESISVYNKDNEEWHNPMLAFKIDFTKGTFISGKKPVEIDEFNVKKYFSRDNEFLTIINYYGYIGASTGYGLTNKMIKTKIWVDDNPGIRFVDESDAEDTQDTQDSDGDTKMENLSDEEIVITDDEAQ